MCELTILKRPMFLLFARFLLNVGGINFAIIENLYPIKTIEINEAMEFQRTGITPKV